jgi:DNA polymerase (family X)
MKGEEQTFSMVEEAFHAGRDAPPLTRNQEVARLLYEMAQILEVQGVPFKPRAYQRAAQNLETLGEDVAVLVEEDRLGDVPGVGQAIEEKVREYLQTGKIRRLEELRKAIPPGVLALLQVPGIGPKTAVKLQKELKIRSVADLEKAAKAGRVRGLAGFGPKKEEGMLASVARAKDRPARIPYAAALTVAEDLVAHLRERSGASRVDYAGSLRRGRDTVGDLDLLAVATKTHAAGVVGAFKGFRQVVKVLESGTTRARAILSDGVHVDLRVVEPHEYGAALLYFTGSKEHGIALRTRALKKGWTINEYALSDKKTGKRIAGATEEEIYAKLGLAWIPPELRENLGEIERAARGPLPELVTMKDLKGELHTHTNESDGRSTLAEMVAGASRLGYAWFGVSDHSKGMGMVNGLDLPRLRAQRKAIDRLQKRYPKIRILQGAEVDIKKTGELGLDAEARRTLDYVIVSVHTAFQLRPKDQTARILKAFDQGADVFAHPTTRKILSRPELDADWERVYEAAAERGVALEVNASPERLDLAGERVRAARERKASFVIDSDAHAGSALAWIRYGLSQARRGGLTASDVLNGLSAARLEPRLGRSRRR